MNRRNIRPVAAISDRRVNMYKPKFHKPFLAIDKNYRPRLNKERYEKKKEIVCYNCQGKGHLKSECPSRQTFRRKQNEKIDSRRQVGRKVDDEMKCSDCGQPGNVKKNCWQSSSNKKYTTNQVKPLQEQMKKFSINLIQPKMPKVLDVQVNGERVTAISDSGAAVSVIQSEVARRSNLNVDETTTPEIATANSSSMNIVGITETKIQLTIKNQSIACNHTLIVAENLQFDMIVGLDLLSKMKVASDYETNTLTFKKNPTYKSDGVYVVGAISIPSYSSVESVVGISNENPNADVMIAPVRRNNRIVTPYWLVKTVNNQAVIMITNPTATCIQLKEKDRVGSWQSIEENGETLPVAAIIPFDDNKNMIEVGDELDDAQIGQITSLLKEYGEVLDINGQLGHTKLIQHSIELTDREPVAIPLRRYSAKEKEEIDKQVQAMIDQGVISPSSSPYSSQIVLVPKKGGGTRFCIDYRKVNAKTVKWPYPLPRIDDNIDSFAGKVYFSVIDCNSGIWQVELEDSSKHVTAFCTSNGHFEFNRMPFGLCNAVSTFQRLTDLVFTGLKGEDCVVYLDDAAIASSSWDQHLKSLKTVLSRFKQAGLTIKLSKCKFGFSSIHLLGHKIDKNGIHPMEAKLDAIKHMKKPGNDSELRRFLGTVSYYRRFIPSNFSRRSAPLTKLLRKDVTWEWSNAQNEAFADLVNGLEKEACVAHFRPDARLELKTDASRVGLGAILLQEDEEKEMKIVSCISRALTKAESNYPVTELEALAIVWAIKRFRPYVYGKKLTILTDHRALCSLMQKTELPRRLAHWALILQKFDSDIKYIDGSRHADVDCLSRSPIDNHYSVEERCVFPIALIIPANENEWQELCHKDAKIQAIKQLHRLGDNKYKHINGLIYTSSGQLIVPDGEYNNIIKLNHDAAAHPGQSETVKRIERNYYWSSIKEDVKRYISSCDRCLRRKTNKESTQSLMNSKTSDRPWQMVAMDS